MKTKWLLALVVGWCGLTRLHAQGTAFTYQGQLHDGANSANGSNDLTFTLFSASSGGTTVGASNVVNDLNLTNGLFSVPLDFGAGAFTGADRWLEIAVRPGASSGPYTSLVPRQKLTASPYAVYAGGVSAAGITGTIPAGSLGGTYGGAVTLNNSANIITGTFTGNGVGLTNLNAGNLAGTLADARLSANVALLAGSQTFTGAKTFSSQVTANNGLRLNNSNLWLRSDNNHGLGWYGNGKPFAAVSNLIDGPVLFGFAGGALGTEQSGTERIALLWNSAGNVGIGTNAPQARLDVAGSALVRDQLHVDFNDQNNSTLASALVFGGPTSGEGIGSKRSGTGNPYGLDFYTANTPRMTIGNDGRVGIGTGTSQPRTLVDIRGSDPILELRNVNDGGRGGFFENTFGSVQLGMFAEGNGQGQVLASGRRAFFGFNTDGKVGSLTNSLGAASPPGFRNLLDDGAGNATIAGNLAAKNLPGVEFDVPTDPFNPGTLFIVSAGQTATIKTITVDAPAGGFLVVLGSVFAGAQQGSSIITHANLELFDETANVTFGLAGFQSGVGLTRTIHGVLPVPAGARTLSLKLEAGDTDPGDRAYYSSNRGTFIAMFFSVRY